jgi:hypothetical protein
MSVEKPTEKNKPAAVPITKKPAGSTGGVQCLRCQTELESYAFTKLTLQTYSSGNVVLECSKCGHIELLSQTSPLLRRLNAKPTAVGDGD